MYEVIKTCFFCYSEEICTFAYLLKSRLLFTILSMKKTILFVSFCLVTLIVSAAKIHSSSGISKTDLAGIDYVFIFNGINSSTTITYDSTATNVKWYEFNNPIPIYSGVDTFDQLENGKGYYLEEENGHKITFWVIDYQKYLANSSKLLIDDIQTSACKNVSLSINPKVPELYYKTLGGDSINIPRDFEITYKTLKWDGTTWQDSTASVPVNLPINSPIIVPAPLCDTYFTLTGDHYAEDLGFKPDSITSLSYSAVAVECHLTSKVGIRTALNENERPKNTTDIGGSAPLEMTFSSNANLPVTQFYNWEIFKDGATSPYITHNDENINNTFSGHGTYKVKITVSNNYCSNADSITVTVSESYIKAPNVFTPNGDGTNDEFRVAYKSIISFEAWVFNRWGRQVYHWTDPQKGWDGNINGRKATPGAYFYIIKALGSDFDPASAPIGKTKLRLGEYLLKGDINLLRGTN